MAYLIIYILIVSFITFLERRKYDTFLTPTICLTLPTAVTIILIIFISHNDSSIPDFNLDSLIIWIWGTIIFFIPSFLLPLSKSSIVSGGHRLTNYIRNIPHFKLLLYAYIFLIIIFSWKAYVIDGSFGSDEFGNEYRETGLNAHLLVFMTALTSFFILCYNAHRKYLIPIIIISLIPVFAAGTKTWIIAPLLIGLFSRIQLGISRGSIVMVIGVILISILIFVVSYVFTLLLVSNIEFSQWIDFIKRHFLNYLCGGPLASSLDFSNPNPLEYNNPESLFTPILNILRTLTGQTPISYYTSLTNMGSLGAGNVRTFLGSIWVHTPGILSFTVIVLVFSIMINVFYIYAIKKRNIFISLANCTNLTFLALGFFDFSWFLLKVYELFYIFIFLYFVSRFRVKERMVRC